MKKGLSKIRWGFLYFLIFLITFIASAAFKLLHDPFGNEFTTDFNDAVGIKYTDLVYGDGDANTFDLYVPADTSRESYGLIVYLHAGGFTSGDKSDDTPMLEWLCSKGYVTAGINYTLFGEAHPDANIYTQSMEIRESMPFVIAEAEKLGYPIGEMAIAGGSAGGCLALLYAYRDADTSPVPVKMVFEGVGPSSFYPEDWGIYGFDKDYEAAAGLFSVMSGKALTADMFGTPAYDEAVRDVSALLWIGENTVPTLCIYGAHDKMQPFPASKRLADALEQYQIPHDYFVCEHSGHGLQNDDREYIEYMRKISEYLDTYMPLK